MANGCRVTTARRNTIVSPASKIFSAISFGVFWRSAPSTSAIMRSRNVSPGFEVIFTFTQSESTRVPPVTAERSPPASRITGADSPVIADSSTDATPSTISPSPGTNSPASTRHISPDRNLEPGTVSVFPSGSRRFAIVSAFARRNASACAFPRPSAMASAKLANKTVNHSHKVICRLNPKPGCPCMRSRMRSTVVTTLPTSTTNITGLRIMVTGCNLTNESHTARRTIFASQRLRFDFLPAIFILRKSIPQKLKSSSGLHQKVLKYWPQTQCREKRQRPYDRHDSDQQYGKQRSRNRESTERGRSLLLTREIPRDRQHGQDHHETPQ